MACFLCAKKSVILLSTETYGNVIADWEQKYKQAVVLHYNRCRRPNDTRVLLNKSSHTLYEVSYISKIEPYIQILNIVFLILHACELYTCNNADGRNDLFLVRISLPWIIQSWVNPWKRKWSGWHQVKYVNRLQTVTVIEQEMTLWLWTKRKVMKKLAPSHCYKKDGHPHTAVIQNILEHNRHTVPFHSVPLKMMMAVNTVGYTDTPQQPATSCWTLPCCPPNSVVHT